MYYQILLETTEKIGKSKSNKVITDIDKSDKIGILNDIIIPYLKNEEFIVNGYNLKKQNIERLKVMTTKQTARELSKYENDHMPSGIIMYVSPEDILDYDNYTTDVTKQLIFEATDHISIRAEVRQVKKVDIDKNKVFIVHGHDNEVKIEVARFVEKLGFEAIILDEQVSNGMTIFEKIEKYSNVGFGIVIYSPCDIGYDKNEEDKKSNRARQNVVFEHGYLIAKLGRNNVCALVKQDVETPSDISGFVYISMDDHNGWKVPLTKEMKVSGYNVDFNLIM